MERLTKRLPSGAADYNYHKSCYIGDGSGADRISQSAFRQRCVERLADYEDTKLTPGEVKSMQEEHFSGLEMAKLHSALMELKKYQEADKAGRLVVRPCKVGDTLFRVFAGEILEHKVSNMRYLAIQGRWDIDTTPFCSYVESSIGKTIFLTREEAKAALEEMKDE